MRDATLLDFVNLELFPALRGEKRKLQALESLSFQTSVDNLPLK